MRLDQDKDSRDRSVDVRDSCVTLAIRRDDFAGTIASDRAPVFTLQKQVLILNRPASLSVENLDAELESIGHNLRFRPATAAETEHAQKSRAESKKQPGSAMLQVKGGRQCS